jgi:hypothetical protein
VERGDGWFGVSASPDRAAQLIDQLQQRRADARRTRLEITLLAGWADGYDPRMTERYAKIDVTG